MEQMHGITIRELVILMLFLGSPVFSLSLIVQILYVRYRQRLLFSWTSAILGAAATLVVSVFLWLLFWVKLGTIVGQKLFMIFGILNLPALLAVGCIVPLMTKLQLAVMRQQTRRQ